MTPEELKREDEFLEAQAKAIREHIERKTDYLHWPIYRPLPGELFPPKGKDA